jgi:hypothetical protein
VSNQPHVEDYPLPYNLVCQSSMLFTTQIYLRKPLVSFDKGTPRWMDRSFTSRRLRDVIYRLCSFFLFSGLCWAFFFLGVCWAFYYATPLDRRTHLCIILFLFYFFFAFVLVWSGIHEKIETGVWWKVQHINNQIKWMKPVIVAHILRKVQLASEPGCKFHVF